MSEAHEASSSAAAASASASAPVPAPAPASATNDSTRATSAANNNPSVSKPKRLACMICRRRKLKCDGIKPSCSTCSRLGHECAYDEVRRKSGPKRGYVKALEERLSKLNLSIRWLLRRCYHQRPLNCIVWLCQYKSGRFGLEFASTEFPTYRQTNK